jgi:hypothetical protein
MQESREGARGPVILAFMLAAWVGTVFLLPADSDGAFAAWDGVDYGIKAERPEGVGALHHFHPLFHAFALPLTRALRAAGVATPGHVAIRILAGAGAAALVFLVVTAAGRGRWLAGVGFAAALIATRATVIEAAVGETVVPGVAAALWALAEATRPRIRWGTLWVALAVALLVRADNVLIVPGVVAAAWAHPESRGRAGRIAAGVALTGAATLAGYLVFASLDSRGPGPFWQSLFPSYLDSWIRRDQPGVAPLVSRVDASSAAIVGRTWPRSEPNLWIGPAFAASLLAAAFLLRGRSAQRRLVLAAAITFACREAFFTWYDVTNPKWSVFTLGLLAFLGSRLAEGEPARSLAARRVGGLILVLLAVVPPVVHGPFTVRLRDRGFISAMSHAVAQGQDCRFLTVGPTVDLGLTYLGVPHLALAPAAKLEDSLDAVAREAVAHASPALIVFERWLPWMPSGDPWVMQNAPQGRLPIDSLPPTPEIRLISWNGYAYGARYSPAESRPR